MDESGNNNPDNLLMVGAVEVLGDADALERGIVDLWQDLSSRRSLRGPRGFEKFHATGFHATDDPIEVRNEFLNHLHDVPFRAYLYMTDRSSDHAGATETAKIGYLYESLLADLLLRFNSEDTLDCAIEENEALRKVFAIVSESARLRAMQKSGQQRVLPEMDVHIVKKTERMSIAIIDYVMIAVQRWACSGYSTNGADWQLRAFRDVEASISILYSLETGVVSSRKTPLH